jgi:uncharacterized protein (TIGR03435 family)
MVGMMIRPALSGLRFARKFIFTFASLAFAVWPFYPAHLAAQSPPQAAPQAAPPAPTAAPGPNPVPNPKEIADTWQGTLHAGQDLRIIIKVTKDEKGAYKAALYSIDQGGQALPFDSITLDGSNIKMKLNMIGGTFEGNLSSDGKTIDGSWSQGPNPLPLVLTRATPETAWEIPTPPPPVPPMAANADPSFEVATIKPSQPDRPGRAFLWRGNQFTTVNTTLMALITFAYGMQQKQVIGGPDWIDSDKFDLEGKPDTPGTPSSAQLRLMVRKLLEDRFQLKFRNDKRELPAYLLVVAKAGPKMTKDENNPNGLPGLFFRQLGDLNVHNATMGAFAGLMQSAVLDRPVVDQTGLTGNWDFELKWTPDDSQFGGMGMRAPPPSDAADAPPPLFTAIQEQIGLKLESEKASVDVMVIDSVEKPSPN